MVFGSFVFSLRSRCPETGVLQKFFGKVFGGLPFCVRLTSKGYGPARLKPGPPAKKIKIFDPAARGASFVLVPVVPIVAAVVIIVVVIVIIIIGIPVIIVVIIRISVIIIRIP